MDTTAHIPNPNPRKPIAQDIAPIRPGKAESLEPAVDAETKELRAPDEAQSVGVPELDSAIKRGAASFTQLAKSIFYSREKFNEDPLDRSTRQRYVEPLTTAFENAHGAITDSYYCRQVIAGAVLTNKQELWIVHPAIDSHVAPIAEIIFECDRLNIEADRVLAGRERLKELQSAKTLIYSLVAHLLSLLDSPTPLPSGILDLLKHEAKQVHQYYLRAAARHAQFDYFRGMLYGIAVGSVVIAVGALFFRSQPLFYCLTAGGFGALVSVMSRMTFGKLSVDYEAGRSLLTMLGAFRPVIGMLLGAAICVLALSGLLAIQPIDPSKLIFFHVLLAFLAGFSERWAQDMLSSAEYQLSGSASTSKGKTNDAKRGVTRMERRDQ